MLNNLLGGKQPTLNLFLDFFILVFNQKESHIFFRHLDACEPMIIYNLDVLKTFTF